MSDGIAGDKPATDLTYPVSQKLSINFSAFEDRLIVRAERMGTGPATLLFTRRMTILVLQQVVARLPELSALDKTPAAYWQEVLQMSHQHAMQAKTDADNAEKQAREDAINAGDQVAAVTPDSGGNNIYLATELSVQLNDKRLMLAFRGLQMPGAMTRPSQHEPVLAIPLTVDNVHQLIELLMVKAHEAQWHLPVDLPWMSGTPVESPGKTLN
ncbi:MAG: hypothetical protein Q7W55_09280 [Pseudohongiella sp.]|nr:hypothetical protein [Pseudohongiella sp.]MDO9519182.1 hypothetical protein [Pseudohongiella sp.]MDP2125779.1 hypothetical protein [Pseudohongiella sp.]